MPAKRLVLSLALIMAVCRVQAGDIVLSIVPPTNSIHVGDYQRFEVTLANRGSNSVTLVRPGDGSECGWRTPLVGWSVLPVEAKDQRHPDSTPLLKIRACGNVNELAWGEVFSLNPGESKRLRSWIGYPKFEKAGKYRLVFYYQNIPDLRKTGISGPDAPGVIDRIRKSTPCQLVSQELVVEVLPEDTAR